MMAAKLSDVPAQCIFAFGRFMQLLEGFGAKVACSLMQSLQVRLPEADDIADRAMYVPFRRYRRAETVSIIQIVELEPTVH
jgi:hypothetical protein